MRVTLDIPRSLALYSDALEGLTRINERLYREAARSGKPMQSIYAGRVRYVREYPGHEDWKHAGRVIADGEGDCEDLSAARAGELRAGGEALARAEIRRTAPNMTHAFVVRANGAIEDPSRRLGMGSMGNDELGFWKNVGRQIQKPKNPAARRAMLRPPTGKPPVMMIPQNAVAPKLTTAQAIQRFASKAQATLPSPSPTSPLAALPAALQPIAKEELWDPSEPDLDEYDEIVDSDDGDPEDEDAIGADPSTILSLTWAIDRTPTGWKGTIRVPLTNGQCALITRNVKGADDTAKKQAVQKGLSAASKLLDNPTVRSLIPPQAQMALNIARSKTARNIAKKISSWF